MAKFDRYMLSQLLLFFGFFALVLVAVFWIGQAVRLFDRLIADGQSLLVFLEFTALGLPRLILMVLPLASFASAVYVMNRLSNESEITVMQAIGSSPWRLTRPVFFFGLIVAAMVAVLSHVLVPTALDRLTAREHEVNQDVTARLLTEGTFVHPSDGVTLYTREIDEDGVLNGVFLSDRRSPEARLIYTAATAYLVRGEGETSLIMIDGLAQRYTPEDGRLATTTFLDFSYDISNMVNTSPLSEQQVRALPSWLLFGDWDAIATRIGKSRDAIAEEFHSRLAQPLFSMATALFGFAVLLTAGFSRFGAWRQILAAFVVLLVLDSFRTALGEQVRTDASKWPLIYVPTLIGFALVTVLLAYSSKPGWRRRQAAP